MKILFMGTPEFAVPSLEKLIVAGHELCGVFTQPDKPKNRGMKLLPTPVKEYALSIKVPVYQPEKLRDRAVLELIQYLDPQLIVVAAYGRILPDEILEYPPFGCINVHSSLLPRYRGAAPINWAILNGDKETGVTIMHMATELDAGDIIEQVSTPIDPNETVELLYTRLAELGGELLLQVIESIATGGAARTPQNPAQVTFAPILSRELSAMDFTRTARQIHNQVRGLIPWPAALMILDEKRCKVFSTVVLDETSHSTPGTVLDAEKDGLKIACGGGTVLRVDELQADGGKRMKAADYLRGHPLQGKEVH